MLGPSFLPISGELNVNLLKWMTSLLEVYWAAAKKLSIPKFGSLAVNYNISKLYALRNIERRSIVFEITLGAAFAIVKC